MLKRIMLACCCLFLLVAQPFAEGLKYYRVMPFSETATMCRTNSANTPCMKVEALVLKPHGKLAACTATFDTAAMALRFSATALPFCQPIQCSTCDLIPPMPLTTHGLHYFYRSFSNFFVEQRKAAMLWSINVDSGLLTICAIDPPTAECKAVQP